MRDIKVRGKRIDNKEWVCGDLVFHYENQRKFILCDQMAYTYTECGIGRIVSEHYFEVIPETVGQYTGLKDKNGTEICENDIVRDCDTGTIKTVLWHKNCFILRDIKGFYQWTYYEDEHEVIGNIYENPELLK